jgi:hypothetical protein
LGTVRAPLVAAVVEMVSVAVTAEAPVIVTGLVEPKLSAGRSWAPLGLDVTVAPSATLPVKPPAGVTVMVDVFPVVAPFAIVTAAPLIVKLEPTAVVTVTAAVPVALL